MTTFGEKIKLHREERELSQEDLGNLCGLTRRSIITYEADGSRPRQSTVRKLATALGVTEYYLSHDECENPSEGIEEEPYIQSARDAFGKTAADQLAEALKNDTSMLAGGTLSEEQKDMFYQAITKAYFMNKERAREKFGRKKK